MKQKIIDIDQLKPLVAQWRVKNQNVVFTNGCFDILHVGHVHTLNEAKQLGDKLIVGLNNDDSVKRLKGVKRPINQELDRATIIAALECVDAVVLFGEDTPLQLIQGIVPDVLVKGGDWKVDEIVGGGFVQQSGGKVHAVPFVSGHSSTNLIDKIFKL